MGRKNMLSIISICYNNEHGIKDTLESIIKSKCIDINDERNKTIEIIVKDGKSTDDTVWSINYYKNKFLEKGIQFRYISEPDKGIYDAMNIGTKMACGEWCLFLNGGDILANTESLGNLLKGISIYGSYSDIIYGDSVHYYRGRYKVILAMPEDKINFSKGMEFCHQSCVIKRDYLIKNPYELKFKIAGDYDFFAKAYSSGIRFKHISSIISIFDKEGISSSYAGIVNYENACIANKYRLVDKKIYRIKLVKAKIQIAVRKIIPQLVLKKRHEYIMKKATSNWPKEPMSLDK